MADQFARKKPRLTPGREVSVTDRLKNNPDSRTPASGKAIPKSPRRFSAKCPSCHRTLRCSYCHGIIHRWWVPAKARSGRKAKAPLFLEALSLHSGGCSWAKIAKQLDPEGFKKDPGKARERIRKGAQNYKDSPDLPGWLLVP